MRDNDLLYAELVGKHAGVRGTRTAECKEHEVARIESLFDGHLANDVRHLELGDPGDAARRFHQRELERVGDALHRVDGFLAIELDAPAEEIVRVDRAEHDVGVGHRRRGASLAVADRSRVRARRLRTDAQGSGGLVDAREGAATGADRLNVDPGQEVFVLRHVGDKRIRRLATGNDADIERSPAHVGGDDVRAVHQQA